MYNSHQHKFDLQHSHKICPGLEVNDLKPTKYHGDIRQLELIYLAGVLYVAGFTMLTGDKAGFKFRFRVPVKYTEYKHRKI